LLFLFENGRTIDDSNVVGDEKQEDWAAPFFFLFCFSWEMN
jgi:hypothetical protein